MAMPDTTTPSSALPGLPDTVLRPLSGQSAALWNSYGRTSDTRPVSGTGARAYAPPALRPPPEFDDDDESVLDTPQSKVHMRISNLPKGASVKASASGTTLHVDTGKGVK